MDLAYDHLQENTYAKESESNGGDQSQEAQSSLNKDLQEAYRSFSASPWGSRIGGFFGNVVKQVRMTALRY